MYPKVDVRKTKPKVCKQIGPNNIFWEHFGSHFPSKMHSKINTKVDVEKVWKFMRKCFKNDAKTRSNIHDKSMNFQNLRFLDFCEVYNVKIVFYMIRGTRNL